MSANVKKLTHAIVVLLLILGAVIRWVMYGDLRLSIGTNDSSEYVEASRAPLLSWDSFTGRRLFTTNILYKLANGKNCRLEIISKPATGAEEFRGVQSCFDHVAFAQNLLSILGWCALAFSFSRAMKNPLTRVWAVLIILVFAFSPQVAEWDSVLSSESLSFSLLALSLALLIEIVHHIARQEDGAQRTTIILITLFLAVFSLWALERDANLYGVVVMLALLVPLFIFNSFRSKKYLIAATVFLSCVLVLGLVSSSKSPRWHATLDHALELHVFPFPSRIAFFEKLGMPDPAAPEYPEWRNAHAPRVYMAFLLSHPGFVVQTLLYNISYLTTSHIQPYYTSPELGYRNTLLTIGEFLHPDSGAVYLLDTLLILSLCASALKYRIAHFYAWTWFALWLFLSTAVILFINFFGDVSGALRHISPPITIFRLAIWLFLLINTDLLLESNEEY